ncbi:porin [Methylobacterium sp. XJLW]|uniref:Porin n=1 Tax=Methylobacterium oryzae CBMB20 TaxID=693986 RepID=A0A089QDT7_9HYPH|nr:MULTISPECIES: outer membrane beta-barrel protein [Methylobacterium]AIQ92759.1 Porin [Methylobacterium oryzae CBMB20]AWV15742.1 porin [Methylobacterium sp. XJLW]
MRTVTFPLLAVLGLCGVNTARAADLDYDYLRGADYDPVPAPVVDWSGVYLGGHGGYTSGGLAQRDAMQSTLANYFSYRDIENEFSVSKFLSLPGTRTHGASFGAFAGFNVQFDDIVLGIEADYTHTNQNSWSTNSISRIMTTSGGNSETVNLSGTSNTRIDDYGSIRARAGYAFGNLLPYVTAGAAIGQVTINDTVAVQNYGYSATTYAANQALTTGLPAAVYNHGYASFNPNFPLNRSTPAGQGIQTIPYAPTTLTANARTKTIGGVALGFGLEYAITPNILVRGEYQYVQFQDFNGHKAELNTVRGGAAVKF